MPDAARRLLRVASDLLLPKQVWLRRSVLALAAIVMLTVSSMYGIGEMYIWQNRHKPLVLGATFIPEYATYLGVDPRETLSAMIHDLGIKHVRLVSYWNDIEPSPGQYNFSDLDWQFRMAEEANVKISLAVGLRQPRWPECHMPDWAMSQPKSLWEPELKTFMQRVIERYRSSPALESYQLENEFFLKVFGICPDFTRQRLVDEYNLVKQIDPNHPLIVNRSNNAVPSWPVGDPRADLVGAAIYKRVWDKTITKRYFEYPVPAWFYAFLAGGTKLTTGRGSFIHELQTEAWVPDGYDIRNAPLGELDKSMNPRRLHERVAYGKGTGMKLIDLWGVEWLYQMKVVRQQPELWNTLRQEYKQSEK